MNIKYEHLIWAMAWSKVLNFAFTASFRSLHGCPFGCCPFDGCLLGCYPAASWNEERRTVSAACKLLQRKPFRLIKFRDEFAMNSRWICEWEMRCIWWADLWNWKHPLMDINYGRTRIACAFIPLNDSTWIVQFWIIRSVLIFANQADGADSGDLIAQWSPGRHRGHPPDISDSKATK